MKSGNVHKFPFHGFAAVARLSVGHSPTFYHEPFTWVQIYYTINFRFTRHNNFPVLGFYKKSNTKHLAKQWDRNSGPVAFVLGPGLNRGGFGVGGHFRPLTPKPTSARHPPRGGRLSTAKGETLHLVGGASVGSGGWENQRLVRRSPKHFPSSLGQTYLCNNLGCGKLSFSCFKPFASVSNPTTRGFYNRRVL